VDGHKEPLGHFGLLVLRILTENEVEKLVGLPNWFGQKKLIKDCITRWGWMESSTRSVWPDWIKHPDRVKGGKAAQMVLAGQREQQKIEDKIIDMLPEIQGSMRQENINIDTFMAA
jgi:hypothetical protein